MWPYPWTHVWTPSHLGHMDRVAATMPSQAHAGVAQEAPDIGQWEGQDVPLVRPPSCNVKGGIPSSQRYLPTYLLSPEHGCIRVQCILQWHGTPEGVTVLQQVVPTRAPTAGQLVTKYSVEYTPSSPQRLFATGCMCSTSDPCCPHPLNHVIIRRRNPPASHFIPVDLLPVWRQCILNAPLPSPEVCYTTVASGVSTALKSIPSENQVLIVDNATHLAS